MARRKGAKNLTSIALSRPIRGATAASASSTDALPILATRAPTRPAWSREAEQMVRLSRKRYMRIG